MVLASLSRTADIGRAVVGEVTGGTKRKVVKKVEGKRQGEASGMAVVRNSIEGTVVD